MIVLMRSIMRSMMGSNDATGSIFGGPVFGIVVDFIGCLRCAPLHKNATGSIFEAVFGIVADFIGVS